MLQAPTFLIKVKNMSPNSKELHEDVLCNRKFSFILVRSRFRVQKMAETYFCKIDITNIFVIIVLIIVVIIIIIDNVAITFGYLSMVI